MSGSCCARMLPPMNAPVPPQPIVDDLPEGGGAPCTSNPGPGQGLPPDRGTAADAEESTYVESERLLSGRADLYAYGDDTDNVVVAREGLPYATRILVRFPTDPQAFSGTVVI